MLVILLALLSIKPQPSNTAVWFWANPSERPEREPPTNITDDYLIVLGNPFDSAIRAATMDGNATVVVSEQRYAAFRSALNAIAVEQGATPKLIVYRGVVMRIVLTAA